MVYLLIGLANTEITYKITYVITKFYEHLNTSLTNQVQSYAFPGNHFVGIGPDSTGNWSLIFISGSNFGYSRSNVYGVLVDEQIRSANFNNDYSTSKFLIFNRDRVKMAWGMGTQNETVFEEAGTVVLDVCFGQSSEIVFVLVDSSYLYYQLVAIVNKTVDYYMDLGITKDLAFDQLLFNNGTLLLSFQSKILYFEIDGIDVTNLITINVSHVDTTLMAMAIQYPYIGYAVNDTFTILRLDTY